MPAARNGGLWLILALLTLFVWGAREVMVAPVAAGDVYPPYSTLRADPLGAKALFESLSTFPELSVSRLYKGRSELDPLTTLFILGDNPNEVSTWQPGVFEGYEKLLKDGGRIVLAFLPVDMPESDVSFPLSKSGENGPVRPATIEERWHLTLRYQGAKRDPSETSPTIPRETAMYFVPGAEWRVLLDHDGRATIIERTLAGGSIVLVADSFPLSNQGLSDDSDADLIARLTGPSRRIIFDENHFGVTERGGVAVLLRKYNLESAIASLFIAAGLFIWRSSSSFLPPRENVQERRSEDRDSHAGLAALLRRSVPESKLIPECLAEWRRTARHARADELESEITKWSVRDPVQAYRAACRFLTEKK